MDNWKRVYSNEDTATKAIPWFWENFDPEHYSIWYGEYKYPTELAKVFMSCNLITGEVVFIFRIFVDQIYYEQVPNCFMDLKVKITDF